MMDAELKCPSCEDYFKSPVLLPCTHNLCSECFEAEGGDEATCGVCSKAFPLGDSGLAKFPRNYVLENIIGRIQEEEGEGGGLECEVCEDEDARNPATKRCLQCGALYCDDCFDQFHQAGPLKRHEGVDPGGATLHSKTPMCTAHEGEPLKVFCINCKVPACYMCHVTGDHKGHRVTELESVCQQKKQELKEKVDQLADKASKMSELEDTLGQVRDTVTASGQEMKDSIQDQIAGLVESINAQENKMTERIQEEEDEKLAKVQELVDTHCATKENCENLKVFLEEALKEGNPANFLLISEALLTRASTNIREKPPTFDGEKIQKFKAKVASSPFDDLKALVEKKIKVKSEPSQITSVEIDDDGNLTWGAEDDDEVEYIVEGDDGNGFQPIHTTKGSSLFIPDHANDDLPDVDKLTFRVIAKSAEGLAQPSAPISWKITMPNAITKARVERGYLMWEPSANQEEFASVEYVVQVVQGTESKEIGRTYDCYLNLAGTQECAGKGFVCWITPFGYVSPDDDMHSRGSPVSIEYGFKVPEMPRNMHLSQGYTLLWQPPNNVAECPPLTYELSQGANKAETKVCKWDIPPSVTQLIEKDGGGGLFSFGKKKGTMGFGIQMVGYYTLGSTRMASKPITIKLKKDKSNKITLG